MVASNQTRSIRRFSGVKTTFIEISDELLERILQFFVPMAVEASDGTIEAIINANRVVVLEDVNVPAFVIHAGKLEDAPPPGISSA